MKNKNQKVISWLDKYLRYVNYLAAAQLYLQKNFFLKNELNPQHIKERILGHWGTVPGQSFIYAHLDYLISKHKCQMLFISGPGHGAPAVISNLFAEGSISELYPELPRNEKGTSKLIKMFSWPGGFPSHTNPGTPGTILEGGELGYSLSTAFGAAFDNPDLIVACVVGDGESETGPLAASWHSNKFLNPKISGAVLPIILVNGYKISGPTIIGTMNDDEVINLLSGYGYEPLIIHDLKADTHDHLTMIKTLEWAYQKIRAIQKNARSQKTPLLKPRWPVIVYRCLKGQSGIKKADGHKIEGNFYSHGIPISDPRENPDHFQLLKKWLESYGIDELIEKNGTPKAEVLKFVPKGSLRMGMCPHAIGGNMRKKLHLPVISKFAVKISKPGKEEAENTSLSAKYLRDVFVLNKKQQNFRIMCPDETESNKMHALFEVEKRAYMWPLKPWDENLSPDGRIMEILSEHTIQGWLQGYVLTGRHGIFVTYEAFATIITSMADQHAKFLKYSEKIPFRTPVPSLNYILTSVGWRQEHNGYSHQNPGFISSMLEKHGSLISVYLPPDANSLLVTLEDCLKRTDCINIIVSNKVKMPQWLTVTQAREQQRCGIGIWDFLNPQAAKNPDVVLAAAGDVMVQESIAAMNILHCILPEIKIRFVNVSELTSLGVGDEHHPLSPSMPCKFDYYFPADREVVFSFHGYPGVIRKLIAGKGTASRFTIHGYLEEGTTTTPFDMMVLNKCSRFDLAIEAVEKAAKRNPLVAKKAKKVIKLLNQKIAKHCRYIKIHGRDMDDINNWYWEDMISCKL